MACTGFVDNRFLDGIIRIRIRVLGLLGALVLVGFLPFGVTLVFLVGVGDQVLSDCLLGDGTDTKNFFGGGGIPEGNTFEGAVFNAPSSSSSDSSDSDTIIVGCFLFLVACDFDVGLAEGEGLSTVMTCAARSGRGGQEGGRDDEQELEWPYFAIISPNCLFWSSDFSYLSFQSMKLSNTGPRHGGHQNLIYGFDTLIKFLHLGLVRHLHNEIKIV